jgi:hypothetical protein
MALNPNLMLSVEQPDGVPVAITLAALAATFIVNGTLTNSTTSPST